VDAPQSGALAVCFLSIKAEVPKAAPRVRVPRNDAVAFQNEPV
jgi:hypothetical protein